MNTIQEHTHTFIHGIIITVIGLILCYLIGKRRFNRRGIGGLQYYSNYGTAVVTTLFEKLVKLIGIVLLIIGLLMTLNNLPSHKKVTTKAITTINHTTKKIRSWKPISFKPFSI
jgi:flagellar biogenesis protein FliO